MDFAFTEEQQQLRRSVREFAEGEIAPHVMEWDEASHFPLEIMPKLAEMGLLGVIFPEQFGGAGLGYIEYAIAIEEITSSSSGTTGKRRNTCCRLRRAKRLGRGRLRNRKLVLMRAVRGQLRGETASTGCSMGRRRLRPTATMRTFAWRWR